MSPRRALAALVATDALLAATASADETSTLDRIEVTGTRISYRDLVDTPAVSIKRLGVGQISHALQAMGGDHRRIM